MRAEACLGGSCLTTKGCHQKQATVGMPRRQSLQRNDMITQHQFALHFSEALASPGHTGQSARSARDSQMRCARGCFAWQV